MSKILERAKQHIAEYYVFYALTCALVAPTWFRLTAMLLYKHADQALLLQMFTIGIALILIAAAIRHNLRQWRMAARILLGAGMLISIIYSARLLEPARSHAPVALLLIISVAVTVGAVAVYVIDLPRMSRERNALIGKIVLKYFVLCAVLLYLASGLLSRYYRHQLDAILNGGSMQGASGAQYGQLAITLDATMRQAIALQSLLCLLAVMLFLCFFVKAKNMAEASLGRV